jgi:hypothetical protein
MQGRVERLDGGDDGDLWRGMQGMGMSGYQAQGRGAYPASRPRGPASNPYYEVLFSLCALPNHGLFYSFGSNIRRLRALS